MALRIVVAVIALLGATLLLVVALGARMPVAHVATRSVTVPASIDAVYALLTDFAAAPEWRSGLDRVEIERDQGTLRFTEVSGSDRLPFTVIEMTPPGRLVIRISGERLPFGGSWAFRLEGAGGGTRVTITEHGEVYSPLFRFVSARVIGHTATLDRYLTDLTRKLGGAAEPEDGPVVPLVLSPPGSR